MDPALLYENRPSTSNAADDREEDLSTTAENIPRKTADFSAGKQANNEHSSRGSCAAAEQSHQREPIAMVGAQDDRLARLRLKLSASDPNREHYRSSKEEEESKNSSIIKS